MLKSFVSQITLAAALLSLAACASSTRNIADLRVAPPSAPQQSLPQQNLSLRPALPPPPRNAPINAGAQDIVLRGVAFAQSGDGRFPPDSTLTVRVFDAVVGNVGDPITEQSYKSSGVLPWPYAMNFRREALAGVRQASLAAQFAGPDGQVIYKSAGPVPLIPGSSEEIPMVAFGPAGGTFVSTGPARVDPFTGVSIERGASSRYGIPDINSSYGAPTFDSPIHPGQSFEQTTISGPPRNSVF